MVLTSLVPGMPGIRKAEAATFSMQTGYYVGTGATLAISGLGFQPNLVIVKADTAGGTGATWKSSAMAASATAFFAATADATTTDITLTSDGFTLSSSSNVNVSGVRWTWIAFGGSDCTPPAISMSPFKNVASTMNGGPIPVTQPTTGRLSHQCITAAAAPRRADRDGWRVEATP